MINSKLLLADSIDLVKSLSDDLRDRCDSDDAVNQILKDEWSTAREAARTASAFAEWREDRLTQVAVAWVLSCVFVRFCEDNELIDIKLAGPGDRLTVAKDRYTSFVTERPQDDQRAYLLEVFSSMRKLSATERLYGDHNLVWKIEPSAVGCKELLEFWWRLADDSDQLRHDFTDADLDTRFLGDLYQDISEDVRDKYALLQTPEFVESFILDRTLDPAIDEFGLAETDLIDPACGSGHFLLGAFHRLFNAWRQAEPTGNRIGHAERAFGAIAGVDLNPYAVAVARFRLLVAALKACRISRLGDAPDFGVQVAVGDSLLHGILPGQQDLGVDAQLEVAAHLYTTEDPVLVTSILSKTYKSVVGNPPYITVKDKQANASYRKWYGSCKGTYSIAVPFSERLFGLAQRESGDKRAGFIGQITANSFMKREFGSKLVENYIPTWDLTALVDTSGAYLPGHGTPTIIMLGRNRNPSSDVVRAVMGLRGEPSTPAVPAEGLVWTAIKNQIDESDSTSEFIRSVDWPRRRLQQHPVVFGGGADLWFKIDSGSKARLKDLVKGTIGQAIRAGADEAYFCNDVRVRNSGRSSSQFRPLVIGEEVRDWCNTPTLSMWYPYDETVNEDDANALLWPLRELLAKRATFQGVMADAGLSWFEYMQHTASAYETPLSITFAFVATHNHFVLDRGGKVFNRSAPVIKLPAEATEEDHLKLLGPLNSSLGCFWMKQVSQNKGNGGIGGGIGDEDWEPRYEFTGTQLSQFPLPDKSALNHASQIDETVQAMHDLLPSSSPGLDRPSAVLISEHSAAFALRRMDIVGIQESLDWRTLFEYGLTAEDLSEPADCSTPLELGERAFEIVLARRVRDGLETTAWFERHGSTPITELPEHWSDEYRSLVERRIAAIEADPAGVGFIERPEFKRRWNWETWEDLKDAALRSWLLDAIEGLAIWREGSVVSVSLVTQKCLTDIEGFGEVAELYAGADVNVPALIEVLLTSEAVPHAAGLRLKSSGLRKRRTWEETWQLQRLEDAIDARTQLNESDPQFLSESDAKALKAERVGTIPKPPAYSSADMYPASWKHRGKLDVPKERFISYPGGEAVDGDTSAVFGWAGWDHAEQGRAVAELFLKRKPDGDVEQLTSLLAGVQELVPWVKQWHNEPDDRGRRQGDQLEGFVIREAAALGLTTTDLANWAPPPKTKSRSKRSAKAQG